MSRNPVQLANAFLLKTTLDQYIHWWNSSVPGTVGSENQLQLKVGIETKAVNRKNYGFNWWNLEMNMKYRWPLGFEWQNEEVLLKRESGLGDGWANVRCGEFDTVRIGRALVEWRTQRAWGSRVYDPECRRVFVQNRNQGQSQRGIQGHIERKSHIQSLKVTERVT